MFSTFVSERYSWKKAGYCMKDYIWMVPLTVVEQSNDEVRVRVVYLKSGDGSGRVVISKQELEIGFDRFCENDFWIKIPLLQDSYKLFYLDVSGQRVKMLIMSPEELAGFYPFETEEDSGLPVYGNR